MLALAAILTVGGRTIANLLRCLGALAPGHPSSYHRALSHRRWSARRLARRYIAAVLARFVPAGPVELVGDDTVTEHPGPQVYGKGCHRDPVRSTHSFTAFRWGHKWVVLAVLVRFPFCRRRWALPLMVALYRPEDKGIDGVTKRAHKTPVDLLAQMLRILIRWFPDRTFVCSADGNYAAHELAELAAANPRRLTFVSKFYPNANLFEPPPPYSGNGRPPVKGKELPEPAQVVRDTPEPSVLTVAWYGGERRRVEVVTGSGFWYRSGRPLVPVRWVFVRDRTGTHRDEYFFTTDVTMSPRAVIETYTGRWNIETTFQEARSYLGLETTRGRVGTRCCGPSRACWRCIRWWCGCMRSCRCGTAGAGGGVAGQERRDLLGRDHGGAALAVGGMGFCDHRSSRGLSKTRWSAAADPAPGAGPGRLRRAAGPESAGSKAVEAVAQRVRAIGLRRGNRALKWERVELRSLG